MDRQLKLHKTARETAVLAAGVQGSQSDMIRLRRVYSASLTPKCPGIRTILLENHCIVHKFNGYDATNGDVTGESAIYVFLTEHGSVYHRKRSCNKHGRPLQFFFCQFQTFFACIINFSILVSF